MKTIKLIILLIIIIMAVLFFYEKKQDRITNAVAVIRSFVDGSVLGSVEFVQGDKEFVEIKVNLTGLSVGNHGFHIHQFGDLRGADAEFAGKHFNPSNEAHGGQNSVHRHIGDLGNIFADSAGKVKLDLKDDYISLNGKNGIVGRAIIIHEDSDKFNGEAGGAGKKFAGGVIGISQK